MKKFTLVLCALLLCACLAGCRPPETGAGVRQENTSDTPVIGQDAQTQGASEQKPNAVSQSEGKDNADVGKDFSAPPFEPSDFDAPPTYDTPTPVEPPVAAESASASAENE